MKYGKRWLALLLAAVTLFTCAAAEEPETPQEEPGAWPELNAEGFLDEGEFVYEGPENDLCWVNTIPQIVIDRLCID